MSINAVIIDDHPLARMAIANMLKNEGISVVGEAQNGAEGFQLVKKNKIDLVIVDVDIPILNGIAVTKKLRAEKYTGIIIVLSAKNDFFYSKRSADVGANAFVSKKEGMANISSAIKAAQCGYTYYPFLLERFIGSLTNEQEMLESLSLQEINIMHYILNGVDNAKIAIYMNISSRTVSTYKSHLFDKLKCKSLADFFAFTNRNNIN